ncbi:hypothetical protein C8F01DRAFT_1250239 [Mycena amicta]|nr:hypothetical protein C8F01DRAFT_1250239 [Mycena amicta]
MSKESVVKTAEAGGCHDELHPPALPCFTLHDSKKLDALTGARRAWPEGGKARYPHFESPTRSLGQSHQRSCPLGRRRGHVDHLGLLNGDCLTDLIGTRPQRHLRHAYGSSCRRRKRIGTLQIRLEATAVPQSAVKLALNPGAEPAASVVVRNALELEAGGSSAYDASTLCCLALLVIGSDKLECYADLSDGIKSRRRRPKAELSSSIARRRRPIEACSIPMSHI